LTNLAQKISPIKIFKSQKLERKKCTLGELWVVHNFSSHEKSNYLALRYTRNLADISHKLSIVHKHIQSMHNELRYQAISEKLSKENIKLENNKKILDENKSTNTS